MAEYTSLTKFKIWPKLGSDYTSQVLKARLSAEQALRVRIAQRNEWARVGLVLLATMALAIVAFMTDSHGRGNISGVLLLLAFLLEAAGVYWALSRNVTDIIALTLVSAIEKMDRHSILEDDICLLYTSDAADEEDSVD